MSRTPKIGRNDPCHCGSGKKFKNCHAGKADSPWGGRLMVGIVLAVIAGAVFAGVSSFGEPSSSGGGPAQVWSPEHGHYH